MAKKSTTNKAKFSLNTAIISVMGEKIYSGNLSEIVSREAIQNALDAKATLIKIDILKDSEYTYLTVTDNGKGISDFNDHFLTLGGSDTRNQDRINYDLIGGFGLAKLAFFACKDWKVESQGQLVNKYLVENEQPFGESEIKQGVVLSLVIPNKKVMYNFENHVKEFCSMVNRQVTFVVNEETIQPFQWGESFLGDKRIVTGNTSHNGYIMVRVNDMPSFYKWVSGLHNTVLVDYHTTESPYSEDYPLIANRDDFKANTKEGQDLQELYSLLSEHIRKNERLEEQKRTNVQQSGKKMMIAGKVREVLINGNVTKEDIEDSNFFLATFARYIKYFCEKYGYTTFDQFKFGIAKDNEEYEACYIPMMQTFMVNVHTNEHGYIKDMKKGYILGLAIHEYTHAMGYDAHNEDFSREMTYLNAKVLTDIQDGNFRW